MIEVDRQSQGVHMLPFHTLNIQDKDLFNTMVSQLPWANTYVSSEYVFENLFAWANEECIRILWLSDFGVIRCKKQAQTWYFPPICANVESFEKGIRWIFSQDPEARLIGITEEMLPYVPKEGLILFDDRLAEFIYDARSFIEMKGSKYHRKRNLMSQFTKRYDYVLKSYEPSESHALEDLIRRYHAQGGSLDDLPPMMKTILHADRLLYHVDMLWVDDKAVGISIGTTSMFGHGVILFEKADIDYIGVYATLANLFARRHFDHLQWITRQEDLGIPEIRASKISYIPYKKDPKYAIHMSPVMKGLHQLYMSNFEEDSKDYVDHFFLHQYDPKRSVFHMIDDNIVSALHWVPKTLRLYGQAWNCPMIVAAATAPLHRKQGFMRKLLIQSLETMYQAKVPIVTLYPVDSDYYRHAGFVTVAYELPLSSFEEICHARLEQTASTQKLFQIYQKAVEGYDGYVIRNLESYKLLLDALGQDGYVASIILHEGDTLGYMIHRKNEIEEIVMIRPCQLNIPEMDISNAKIPYPYGNPAQMGRIVNLKTFMKTYQPPKDLSFEISFCLEDPVLPDQSGCYHVVALGGKIKMTKIEKASFGITIRQLSEIVFQGTEDPRFSGLFPKRKIIHIDKY